jgi:hypothetical protein
MKAKKTMRCSQKLATDQIIMALCNYNKYCHSSENIDESPLTVSRYSF